METLAAGKTCGARVKKLMRTDAAIGDAEAKRLVAQQWPDACGPCMPAPTPPPPPSRPPPKKEVAIGSFFAIGDFGTRALSP